MAKFQQVQTQQEVTNKEKSNEVVQGKTHIESTTQIRITPPKSRKSHLTKQLLHKSPICSPKTVKNRLKYLYPKNLKQLKQKPQASIGQPGKIQMNTKVNNERSESVFKLPSAKFDTVPSTSRTKSPIRMNKQCNAQGLTKSLQRSYSIESMDSDTNCIIANLNLEDIINKYNTWNHLTMCQ